MNISWWKAWLAIVKALDGMGIPEPRIQTSDTLSTFGLDTADKWPEFWLLLRRSLSEGGYELPVEAISAPPRCTVFRLPDLIVSLIDSVDREHPEEDSIYAETRTLREHTPRVDKTEQKGTDEVPQHARPSDRFAWYKAPQPESGIGIQIF